jgi:MoxR-like ATPase
MVTLHEVDNSSLQEDHMEQHQILQKIRTNIARILVGKQEAIDLLLIALLCKGHVLIEDVPGVGKTTLAQAFARSLDLGFQRIQFTPDVLPSDITGYNLYQMKTGQMEFFPGAVLHQIVLADEINRSSPKTQSSLLEVMEERQVTVDGVTYPVPQPFMVLATQNPVEFAGTFPLPEAQLERFLVRVTLGYPSHAEELSILEKHLDPPVLATLEPVAGAGDIAMMQQEAGQVGVSVSVMDYIAQLVEKTRDHESISLGISTRGSIALMQAARARACLRTRSFVLPDDVQDLMQPVLLHRLVLRPEAALHSQSASRILGEILKSVPVPAIR